MSAGQTPADLLRRAATLMREQHGPDHKRHVMWASMADWLDVHASDLAMANGDIRACDSPADTQQALAVGRAYLEEQS